MFLKFLNKGHRSQLGTRGLVVWTWTGRINLGGLLSSPSISSYGYTSGKLQKRSINLALAPSGANVFVSHQQSLSCVEERGAAPLPALAPRWPPTSSGERQKLCLNLQKKTKKKHNKHRHALTEYKAALGTKRNCKASLKEKHIFIIFTVFIRAV